MKFDIKPSSGGKGGILLPGAVGLERSKWTDRFYKSTGALPQPYVPGWDGTGLGTQIAGNLVRLNNAGAFPKPDSACVPTRSQQQWVAADLAAISTNGTSFGGIFMGMLNATPANVEAMFLLVQCPGTANVINRLIVGYQTTTGAQHNKADISFSNKALPIRLMLGYDPTHEPAILYYNVDSPNAGWTMNSNVSLGTDRLVGNGKVAGIHLQSQGNPSNWDFSQLVVASFVHP